MIIQLRLDERLIHGQIAAAWARALPIDTIVCASDSAAQDSLRQKMLLMAAPSGMRARVRSVDQVISLLSDPRADKMNILLITDKPESVLNLVEKLPINEINIANYHCPDRHEVETFRITETCLCNKNDLDYFKKIVEKDCSVFSQMLPSLEKKDFKKLLEAVKGEN